MVTQYEIKETQLLHKKVTELMKPNHSAHAIDSGRWGGLFFKDTITNLSQTNSREEIIKVIRNIIKVTLPLAAKIWNYTAKQSISQIQRKI
jgi:hypothetical protein